MKKALILAVVAALSIGGCHNLAGNISPVETYVSTFEIVGAVAPLAKIYLAELEAKGTLAGDKLAKFKTGYAEGKANIVQAGGFLDNYIDSPAGSIAQNYPFLLQQSAVILADLTGGLIVKNEQPMNLMNMKKPIPGLRLETPDKIRAARQESAKITPDQIILSINLLLMAIDKVVAQVSTPEELTAEQKVTYHQRVKLTLSAVPDWP